MTIAEPDHARLFERLDSLPSLGVDLAEIRLDHLKEPPQLAAILARRTCLLIATVRRPVDGGEWTGAEEVRRQLLRHAVELGFDYVDIEHDIAGDFPRAGSTKRIVSYHNMAGMPEDIGQVHREMNRHDADVIKIAAKALSPLDNFRVLDLLRQANRPTVALCMGELGMASRVLGAKFGCPFMYASPTDRLIAPGMIPFDVLRDLYRYEHIGTMTALYAVIGDPIAQSMSPLVHNHCLKRAEIDGVYVPFRVPPADLDPFLVEATGLGFRGLSVTIPHKQGILRHGYSSDPLVERCGAANTMVRRGDGWELFNTDGPAVVAAFAAIECELNGRTVLLLGAGGVARTIAHALKLQGSTVLLTARDPKKSAQLAAEIGCGTVDWEQRGRTSFDILINGTSVGMVPNTRECPFPVESLEAGQFVFDTVYNPIDTLLLQHARERGCVTISGVEMFVRQAEAQFRIFTDREPPAGLMHDLVERKLRGNEPTQLGQRAGGRS